MAQPRGQRVATVWRFSSVLKVYFVQFLAVKFSPAVVICVLLWPLGDRLAPPRGVYYDNYHDLPGLHRSGATAWFSPRCLSTERNQRASCTYLPQDSHSGECPCGVWR